MKHYFDETGKLTVEVTEKKEGEQTAFQMGTSAAILDEEYFKENPEFLTHIVAFAENLTKQLGCSGVRIHSLSFGRITHR